MNFYVATLFPEQVTSYLNTSITGRGMAKGAFSLECIQMRDYAPNTYGRVDDTIYGGGTGMMIRCEPVYGAYEKACELAGEKPYTVFMSPKGHVFNEKKAHELASHKNLLIICGHYEGIDARVTDMVCDEELSIGDYVLTGGEMPALIVADAVCRMVPGVLAEDACFEEESHYAGLLEHPQYTRPPVWNGMSVPEELLSGHHARIAEWKRLKALEQTAKYRPDLLAWADISPKEKQYLMEKQLI